MDNPHKNARTTPYSREQMVKRVLEDISETSALTLNLLEMNSVSVM